MTTTYHVESGIWVTIRLKIEKICPRFSTFSLRSLLPRRLLDLSRMQTATVPEPTLEGTIPGAPAYMSPEQAHGREVDKSEGSRLDRRVSRLARQRLLLPGEQKKERRRSSFRLQFPPIQMSRSGVSSQMANTSSVSVRSGAVASEYLRRPDPGRQDVIPGELLVSITSSVTSLEFWGKTTVAGRRRKPAAHRSTMKEEVSYAWIESSWNRPDAGYNDSPCVGHHACHAGSSQGQVLDQDHRWEVGVRYGDGAHALPGWRAWTARPHHGRHRDGNHEHR